MRRPIESGRIIRSVTSGEDFDTWTSLCGRGQRSLQRLIPVYKCMRSAVLMYHDQTHGAQLSVQQEVHRFDPFPCLVLSRSPPTDHSHSVSSSDREHHSLSPQRLLLGVTVLPTISTLRHEAGTHHNSYIQFPIYTILLTHVEVVTSNTSLHQYCVRSIAPPTGNKKSHKHHLIDVTSTAGFLLIIHYNMTRQ